MSNKIILTPRKDENGLWGYVSGWVIQPIYDKVYEFSHGLGMVKLNGKYGFIKEDGTYLFEPIFEDANSFSDGVAPVKKDGKWGIINIDGNWILEPTLECSIDEFHEGYAQVWDKSKRLWGYIKTDGSFLVEPKFNHAKKFKGGFAAVTQGNQIWGYIKTDGTFLVEPIFDSANEFNEGIATVKLDNKWGYLKADGSYLIEPEFDNIMTFMGGFGAVSRGGLTWEFIDKNGKPVFDKTFWRVEGFENGKARVKESYQSEWRTINTKGEFVDND